MVLQDIFDALTYGELSQLAIGGAESGLGMCDDDKPKILNHIQLGLTSLYTRFRLKEANLTIPMVQATTTYEIDTIVYPDLLKVEDIFDDNDIELVLNERNNPCSLRTPIRNVLEIPELILFDEAGNFLIKELKVVYRANHPLMDPLSASYGAMNQAIELPQSHLQALLFFVGSRIMNPVGMTNEFHAGNSYYAKYEGECQRLEMEGMEIDNTGYSTRFEERGFV